MTYYYLGAGKDVIAGRYIGLQDKCQACKNLSEGYVQDGKQDQSPWAYCLLCYQKRLDDGYKNWIFTPWQQQLSIRGIVR